MRELTNPALTAEIEKHLGGAPVAKAAPFAFSSYMQLVEIAAHLSFLNKDHLLFFRSRQGDYMNKAGSSTLYPAIYRENYLALANQVSKSEIAYRFRKLDQAAKILKKSAGKCTLERINQNLYRPGIIL